jgi:putative transposase
LFMVNVAHVLLRPFRKANPHFGVLDLKAYCRGQKYVAEILKFLPENPEPIIMEQIGVQIFGIGSIHGAVPVFNSP